MRSAVKGSLFTIFLSSLSSRPVPPTTQALNDVAELKAWSRRAWWADHYTPVQKAHAMVEFSLKPWRFVTEASNVFRTYALFVSQRFGTSSARQLLDMTHARVRYGLDPIAYYRFQLFRSERWAQAGRYVQNGDTGRVLRWLVANTPGYPPTFGDKRAFAAWCVEKGLPSVKPLIEFEGGRVTRMLAPDEPLPAADLFSKPSNWHGGHGAERWVYRDDGTYIGSAGRAHTAAALIDELANLSRDIDRPVLLQRALRNAAREAQFSPGALCTARLTTIRQPHAAPELLFAVYRMPADAVASVDNFGAGGFAAPIDVATGRLGRANRKELRLTPVPVAIHPATGAPIEGHRLSHWAEAVRLVLRAHEAITWQGVPIVGWDVALLEDGPVLVEGNNVPCSTLAQMALEIPLADTRLPACLNAHLRKRFTGPSAR